ncbi:MAG: GyrI-like domain-containing protein [Bauldia litoralis]
MLGNGNDPLTPRFAGGDVMRVVGLAERYTEETLADIPAQWSRFSERLAEIGQRLGPATFGLFYPAKGSAAFDYVTGVMVSDAVPVPDGLVERRIPARTDAIFTHRGHVSGLRPLTHRIFHEWLPRSGRRAAGHPLFAEVYGDDFDPAAAAGVVEVWVPLTD